MQTSSLLVGDAAARQCYASLYALEAGASRRCIRIADLHPTQSAVGFREVARKRERYRQAGATHRREMIQARPAPVVLGPHRRPFVLDRHHWLCALLAEGVTKVPALIVDDLDWMGADMFWRTLEARGWCRPYDARGVRQGPQAMPSALAALQDDPFRSLASELRRRGGFDKSDVLFSEFRWADHLRRRLDREDLDRDFEAALGKAIGMLSPPARPSPLM